MNSKKKEGEEILNLNEGHQPLTEEASRSSQEEAEGVEVDRDTVEKRIARLEDYIKTKEKELGDLQDKYLRLYAEFDNYKKRVLKDQTEFLKYANENIIKELLPVIDNLERAIKHSKESAGGEDVKKLIEGVELTLKQFTGLLNKFGVTEVPSVGEFFDPTKHQAVSQVESEDLDDNMIIKEFQKGYFYNNRILRPAMVSIAKKIKKKD